MRPDSRIVATIGLAIIILISSSSVIQVDASDTNTIRSRKNAEDGQQSRRKTSIDDADGPNDGENFRYMIKYKADSEIYQMRLDKIASSNVL